MVVLPEMWNCPYSNESFPTFAEDIEGDSSQSAAAMAAAAKQHGITLVAGSIPEKHAGHLYNTCLVYDRQGQRLARFRKVTSGGPFVDTSCAVLLMHGASKKTPSACIEEQRWIGLGSGRQ